ncbi:PREDICTED: solute carrier family 22 member 7-like, partial [Apaloderma vittatum]|uniref:solute carrier family 22 member 7-like n=1 Tax=Apaloderma vittatum TaxID=57397 RepID=UPI0005213C56
MKFEDLLLEIGGFGRFQILILFILCLPRINLPMHFLLHNFLAATPSHHCAIPHQEAFANLTMEEVLLISIPREPDGTFRSCEMFSQPQFHLLLNSSLQPQNNSSIQHCQHGWVYDHSQFTSTISTQWDLVCEQRGLNQATATFFFIGVTMGAVVFGYLSDRFDPFQAVPPVSWQELHCDVQKLVQVTLEDIASLWHVDCTAQLGVICKLAEGALKSTVYVIDADIEEHWSQHRPLRDNACLEKKQ